MIKNHGKSKYFNGIKVINLYARFQLITPIF